jgi:hypothetical protein
LGQRHRLLHFGLGASAQPVEVEITWPDGQVQRLRDVQVDRLMDIGLKPLLPSTESAPSAKDKK